MLQYSYICDMSTLVSERRHILLHDSTYSCANNRSTSSFTSETLTSLFTPSLRHCTSNVPPSFHPRPITTTTGYPIKSASFNFHPRLFARSSNTTSPASASYTPSPSPSPACGPTSSATSNGATTRGHCSPFVSASSDAIAAMRRETPIP